MTSHDARVTEAAVDAAVAEFNRSHDHCVEPECVRDMLLAALPSLTREIEAGAYERAATMLRSAGDDYLHAGEDEIASVLHNRADDTLNLITPQPDACEQHAMKTAAEWWASLPAQAFDYQVQDFIRAIQADALEAAAKVCEAIGAREFAAGQDTMAINEAEYDIRALLPDATDGKDK